jgi:hypothetical protein
MKDIKPMVLPFQDDYTKLLLLPLSPKDSERQYDATEEGTKLEMVSSE